MADDAQWQLSGTRPVAPQQAFDVKKLAAFMREHLSGFEGGLSVEPFKGDRSNPTLLLTACGHRYVLRRKPPALCCRVIAALHRVDPTAIDLTDDGKPGHHVECHAARWARQYREPNPDEWTYHLVFNMFRLVGILQEVTARALQGKATSARAIESGRRTRPLAEQAWALAQSIGKG